MRQCWLPMTYLGMAVTHYVESIKVHAIMTAPIAMGQVERIRQKVQQYVFPLARNQIHTIEQHLVC